MKRILLATTFLFAAGAAFAADMEYKATPLPRAAAAPILSWTGFYIGVNAGIGGDKVDYPFNVLGGRATGSLGMQSFGGFAGGQVGYQYQFVNGVVAGVETDIQWSNVRSNTSANVNAGALAASLDAGTEVKWFGTARGRIGFTMTPQTLLYATGGYAYGSETTSAGLTIGGNGGTFSRDATLSGWVAGGGLEYAFSPNVSMKTEYLYFDFGKRNVFTSAGAPPVLVIDNDITMHTLKAGLNYRF